MNEKKWWKSKIFGASVITIVTGVVAMLTGEVMWMEAAMTIFGAVVAIFRLFFTKTNLTT